MNWNYVILGIGILSMLTAQWRVHVAKGLLAKSTDILQLANKTLDDADAKYMEANKRYETAKEIYKALNRRDFDESNRID